MQSSDNAPMTQATYVARVQCLQRSKMTEKFANKTGNFIEGTVWPYLNVDLFDTR